MKLLIGIFIILNFSVASAQEETTTSTIELPNAKKNQPGWIIGVAFDSASFRYQEPGIMTVNGRINGINAQASYKGDSSLWFLGNATYLTGDTLYDGRLNNVEKTPIQNVDHFTIMDFAAKGLILTDVSTSVGTSLYFGIGQRTTDDANDPSPSDYFRRHIYNYYSLGVHVDAPHSSTTASTWIVGIDTLANGTTETRLSDVDPSYADFTMKFKGGSALNIEWQYRTLIDLGTIYGGIAYSRWNLNQSEVATVFNDGFEERYIEPKNSTTTISLKLGAQF